jgi:anti-sigma factor RsiW
MTCLEFRAHLHAYVDGELPVGETAAAEAHAAECAGCGALVRGEREFRQLLRRQPREGASAEFRGRLAARLRRESRRARVRRWLAGPVLGAAAAAVVVAVVLPLVRPAPSVVGELVDKHIAYAQVAEPAEFASAEPAAVARWFLERAGLRVTVPDYAPAGIQLLGGRLAEAHRRRAAYLLYEKGRTLLSVFMVPVEGHAAGPVGERVSYRGHEYVVREERGYRTVAWVEGRTLFGLVSALDEEALLECADRLRAERANLTGL